MAERKLNIRQLGTVVSTLKEAKELQKKKQARAKVSKYLISKVVTRKKSSKTASGYKITTQYVVYNKYKI